MAPKFALFTKGSKLPLNKGLKNMFKLLQSCAQPQFGDISAVIFSIKSYTVAVFLFFWKNLCSLQFQRKSHFQVVVFVHIWSLVTIFGDISGYSLFSTYPAVVRHINW